MQGRKGVKQKKEEKRRGKGLREKENYTEEKIEASKKSNRRDGARIVKDSKKKKGRREGGMTRTEGRRMDE